MKLRKFQNENARFSSTWDKAIPYRRGKMSSAYRMKWLTRIRRALGIAYKAST